MITAKCWVCRDRKHGVLYCNKCADSMERKAKAWNALWEWHKDATAQVQKKGEAFFVPAWAFLEKATDLLTEMENDDGKSQTGL